MDGTSEHRTARFGREKGKTDRRGRTCYILPSRIKASLLEGEGTETGEVGNRRRTEVGKIRDTSRNDITMR